MISSVTIEGYRGFKNFEMPDLGRINLLVGTNNSGKTSILEAIHLLTSAGDPLALWQVLSRRGERSLPPAPEMEGPRVRRRLPELSVAHIFTGHDSCAGARITLKATTQELPGERPAGTAGGAGVRTLTYTISELTGKERVELFGPEEDVRLASRLVMQIKGNPKPSTSVIPLGLSGGLSSETLEMSSRRNRFGTNDASPSNFITTESLSSAELVDMWNKVALQPIESLVLNALKSLEPRIERIAAQVSSDPYVSRLSRGGFILKLEGAELPIPIGSMGDGMWRMLAMAITLTQAKGGVLLVDEIDTGLHYSVMAQMWRLIANAANELGVQVFATTHSYDCVYSLASICDSASYRDGVTLQRIEAGGAKSVPYTSQEIAIAAERGIEMR